MRHDIRSSACIVTLSRWCALGLVVVLGTGCQVTTLQGVSPNAVVSVDAFTTGAGEHIVEMVTNDGLRTIFDAPGAQVVRDSVIGTVGGRPVRTPTGQITRVWVQRPNRVVSVLASASAGLVFAGAVAEVMVKTFGWRW